MLLTRVVTLALAVLAGGCGISRSRPDSAARTAAPDSLPLTERLRIVAAMDKHTREHFAHWSGMNRSAYDSLLASFRARAARAGSRLAFDYAALEFVASLQNGHTRFRDEWLWKTHGQTLWLFLRPSSDGWIVTMSEYDGLRRGDLVTSISGSPIEQFYRDRRQYIAESGERMRRVGLTNADYLFPAQPAFGLADGREVRVVRGEPADSVVTARRGSQPTTVHRWVATDSIAYVRVRRFTPRAHEDSALAVLMRDYARAPAVILDVRGNGGGNTPSRLTRYLMGDSSVREMPVESSTIASDRLRALSGLRFAGGGARYRGELVILADEGCASACDDFVAPFAFNRRALVVGDTTWGSTGQPKFLDLGNGMSYQVSARRYRMPDGSRFEGVGIAPHVHVPLRAAALRAGTDEPLDTAVARLRARLTSR
jgi:carboxyl-terminal processing protease